MTKGPADIFLSIIVPAYNEAGTIIGFLQPLQTLRAMGCEVILVDGGSSDNTQALAEPYVDCVIESDAGRAKQMNKGAQTAQGEYLLFLHADTYLPDGSQWHQQLVNQKPRWAFFPVQLSSEALLFRVISFFMNCRSRLTKVATGDQSVIIHRHLFVALMGFPEIELMEDIAMSKILRKIAKPWIFDQPVITSSRRWQEKGVIKTITLMWFLRLAYVLKVDAKRLRRYYYG